MEFTLGQVAKIIGGEVEGDSKIRISKISSIEEAKTGSVSFLSNLKYESHIYKTQASAVIVGLEFQPKKALTTVLIRVENAYLAFTSLLGEYQRIMDVSLPGVETPSHLPESVKQGKNLYLGAFAYVGDNVTIGDNVKIYPHVYVGNDVTIGDNSILYPGVKIYQNCKIGKYCTLQAGAVVGSHGFGFAPKKDGTYENIPQIGNVILEDHVDVGANTTVDCATLKSTIVKKGVKLDNLVQIAHNVEVGENTVMAAQSAIAGSTKVGKQVAIGGQAGISGHLHIADHTVIGAQTGVMKNTESGEMLLGTPATDRKKQFKSFVIFKKLPEVMKRIEELEEKLLNLSSD